MKRELATHKIEMPNGDCITVEGGSAESIARRISNELGLAQQSQTPATNAEEPPLIMPVMQFAPKSKPSAHSQPQPKQAPAHNDEDEMPPLMPPVV